MDTGTLSSRPVSTTNPGLPDFAMSLLQEMGMTDEDQDVVAEMRDLLVERLETKVNNAVLSALPESSHAEFLQLVESGDQTRAQDFCAQAIPNLAQVVANALREFRSAVLDIAE